MTAINGLVDAAGRIGGLPLKPMAAMQDTCLSMQALCESFLTALEHVPGEDYFRAEFHMPAEPPDFSEETDREPPQQSSSPGVSVGVNVYAVARQIQDALDRMQKASASVPEAYSRFADMMPAPYMPVSKEITGELTRDHFRELLRETPKESSVEVREPPPTAPPEKDTAAKGPDRRPETMRPTISQSVEQNIKRSTLVVNEMESVVRQMVSMETVRDEVFRSSSIVERLNSVRVDGAVPPEHTAADAPQAAVDTPANKGWPAATGPDTERRHIPFTPPAVAWPAAEGASADSTTNARGLAEALSRSVASPTVGATETVNRDYMHVRASPAITHVSKAMATILNTYSMAGAHASPAAQSPIITLINNLGSPRVTPVPVDVFVQGAGHPAQAALQEPASPIVNLAVSMAAMQAAQKSGTSVIREFVKALPSLGGSVQAASMPDNIINVAAPAMERETSSSVTRASSFHNTFNISVNVKGGSGEEGELRELGKKIGRILSDEMKRYGGA